MKKIFHLQKENKNPDRLLEAVKNDIRSYLKRERRKSLPEGAVFWDFDCSFGQNSELCEPLQASELISALDKAREANWDACFVTIQAKPSFKKRTLKELEDTELLETESASEDKDKKS